MRLLIVGTLKGQLTTATKIAMDNGASVTHAEAAEILGIAEATVAWRMHEVRRILASEK